MVEEEITMDTHQSLKNVFSHLDNRNLSAAIVELENYLSVHPHQVNSDRLHALKTDYQLMADYWKRGFKDPQLPALYQSLLQRMYVLCANISKHYGLGHSAFMSSVYMRLRMTARDWSPQNIREELEAFVSETALLELEPEHLRKPKMQELYRQHQHQMNVLFDYVYTSDIWSDGKAAAMEELLLSPTVDNNDQQLIVSAVMLSLLEHFDISKFRTLVHVYQQATDERVRQRALVGWVLSLDSRLAVSVYPEQKALVTLRSNGTYRKGVAGFLRTWGRTALVMCGGIVLIVLLEYIPFFANLGPGADLLFGSTFGGPFMSLMILLLPQIVVYSGISSYIYRQTGNIYVSALICAVLACWIVTGGSSFV